MRSCASTRLQTDAHAVASSRRQEDGSGLNGFGGSTGFSSWSAKGTGEASVACAFGNGGSDRILLEQYRDSADVPEPSTSERSRRATCYRSTLLDPSETEGRLWILARSRGRSAELVRVREDGEAGPVLLHALGWVRGWGRTLCLDDLQVFPFHHLYAAPRSLG